MFKNEAYEKLGLPRGADETAVKARFRTLAKQFHPDRNPGDKAAEARFKEINEAYQTLNSSAPDGPSASWSAPRAGAGPSQRGGQTRPSDDALLIRAVELTFKFNSLINHFNRATQYREAASREYAQRNPGLQHVFRRYVMTPERREAARLLNVVKKPEAIFQTQMEIISTMNSINKLVSEGRPIDHTKAHKFIDDLEKRMDRRMDAFNNALEVLSGRTNNLRYRAAATPS